jgi:hypothetical protein
MAPFSVSTGMDSMLLNQLGPNSIDIDGTIQCKVTERKIVKPPSAMVSVPNGVLFFVATASSSREHSEEACMNNGA